MRVAVTGATGNLGTSVLAVLCAEPAVDEIVGIARRWPPQPVDKVRWVSADVATDDLAPAFAGADVVIHLAWLIQPSRDPQTTWSTNVLGSSRVFQAAAGAGVRAIVYASSVGAYSVGSKDRAVDSLDVGQAFLLAALRDDARGAFNVAAEPPLGPDEHPCAAREPTPPAR